ncbi:SDR family oxidoreductase [Asaia krungthepensis]|uniref:Dehydrogenase n=1 Tax=Asaia krungthepensis NRIC 0535 TaxID=1307925 RepID=A0ABQ0Q5D8_9PROT|nr:SDR family oxidoreductase [Asaia krungthepensis]GBQ92267.1 dehydrogenase [Asaia krungthepensis NRIC 0535]
MSDVIVLTGAGSIGQAIARRVSAGKILLIADVTPGNAETAAKTLADAGYDVRTASVDIASRRSVEALATQAQALGPITGLIQAAGVSPSQGNIETILKIDLYGTALVLECFGKVIATGGAGLVISSQSGHRMGALTPEQDRELAVTPVDALLDLPFLQPDAVRDTLHAYQLSKRANGLRVRAQAINWGKRGARVNAISPGIVITPLANDELRGPRGASYRSMIESSLAGRAGTPDEIATLAALIMSPDGRFITGSDFLIDGGTTAVHWCKEWDLS